MEDILDKLRDLHKQATTERSHYYVASCCREAIEEIGRIREQNTFLADALTKVIEDMKQVMRNSTAQIVEIERVRKLIKPTK